MSETPTRYKRLLDRLAYMTYGPGRPAKHHFVDGGDEVVRKWREERGKLVEQIRKEDG